MRTLLCFIVTLSVVYAKRHLDCSWMKSRLEENNIKRSVTYTDDEGNASDSELISRIYEYPKGLETLVNQQIKTELNAFYNYLSMSQFFHREDHYMEGFAKYFHDAAMEELKHAEMFMKYQAKRGGRVKLLDLPAPSRQTWNSGYHVFKAALTLEKNVTAEVLCLHQVANEDYNDVDFVNFVEGEIIPEQYAGMRELTNHINTFKRMSAGKENTKNDFSNYGIAETMFDQKFNKA